MSLLYNAGIQAFVGMVFSDFGLVPASQQFSSFKLCPNAFFTCRQSLPQVGTRKAIGGNRLLDSGIANESMGKSEKVHINTCSGLK